jgi:LmbE family N-acetylglucosaminyl deacetylase
MRHVSRPGAVVLSLVVLSGTLLTAVPAFQDDRGLVGLGLLIRRLATVGVFMQATAHPDDENNALLVMLGRGQGIRTILATATRGDGGQNEIGPELFEALSVLRTEELVAVHRVDGAEQYFTRAVDFGYSYSIQESFDKWGRDEILGDYVRLIRLTRPDVIATLSPSGTGGGQHHQAAAVLTKDAFRAAGDPARYPEQIAGGLRPWQAAKLYMATGFGRGAALPPGTRAVAPAVEAYDALLGSTYAEIGSFARSMHKSQGMAQLLTLPGAASPFRYVLADTTLAGQADKEETSLFDGIDTRIEALVRFVPDGASTRLTSGLATIARHANDAMSQFERDGGDGVLVPLLDGLDAVRSLRADLPVSVPNEAARFEIDARLATKQDQFEEAIVAASGLRVDALADDGVVVPGESLKATLLVANRGRDVVDVRSIAFAGFVSEGPSCQAGALAPSAVSKCETALRVPAGARVTAPYWKPIAGFARYEFEPDAPFGLPFRPTPFETRLVVTIQGRELTLVAPVVYRYEGNIFSGEKRMELKVVPAFSVRLEPDTAIIPTPAREVAESRATMRSAERVHREVRVTVTNSARGAASGTVTLDLPPRWRSSPDSVPLQFTREDEAQTVRFTLDLSPSTPVGEYQIKALVRGGGTMSELGYQVVEYPHIQRRHLIVPALASMKIVNVHTREGLTAGYVMGVGDQVPEAIEQLGVKLELIDPEALAWGDLDRYDVIITGVRAYERRADLRAHNDRLLEYARRGGLVIVQYNKFEFNEAQYGPYPARVSQNRITDETAPVTLLVPDHPAFHSPNEIGPAAWSNWVQERGLYFLGEKDAQYVDLVEMTDPFEYNRGPKRGALVEARVGRGRWIYLGLGLWRQLPAGTDGAYQLLANLLSLGRSPGPRAPVSR